MAVFLLSPSVLTQAAEAPEVDLPALKVEDDIDWYCGSEGDGCWVRDYIEFLQGLVRRQCRTADFSFSGDERLVADLFKEIPLPSLAARLIEFTNENYEDWKGENVVLPSWDGVRESCREDRCADCEGGWEVTYGTYRGPRAEDVEADENAVDPSLPQEERNVRLSRNRLREEERVRRRAARLEAEGRVVRREFICDTDCDNFLEHAEDEFREQIEVNTAALKDRWDEFLAERGEDDFPPLQP